MSLLRDVLLLLLPVLTSGPRFCLIFNSDRFILCNSDRCSCCSLCNGDGVGSIVEILLQLEALQVDGEVFGQVVDDGHVVADVIVVAVVVDI